MIAIDRHHWEPITTGMFAGWSKCRACPTAHKKSTAEVHREAVERLASSPPDPIIRFS